VKLFNIKKLRMKMLAMKLIHENILEYETIYNEVIAKVFEEQFTEKLHEIVIEQKNCGYQFKADGKTLDIPCSHIH
jgi:hypothetical protein